MPTGVYTRTKWHNNINSEGHKGIIAGMKGKKHSKAARKKISLAGMNRKQSEETKKLRGVYKSGKDSPTWKGGIKTRAGYFLKTNKNHPFSDSCGYVREHRLVVEKQIGRYLTPKEIVHHINEIRNDNRIENLMAFNSNSAHQRFHGNPDSVKPEEIIFDGRTLQKRRAI